MKNEFKIRRMHEDEVQIAIDWAKEEGWNPGIHDAACFYLADNNGFFLGELNNEIITLAAGVIYDENFAFCGLYIVKPKYRKQGFGIQLTKARLDYIDDRITGLDGVLEMTDKYANLGYKAYYQNMRFQLDKLFKAKIDAHIIASKNVSWQALLDFDRKYFPAKRDDFLNAWLTQDDAYSYAYINENKIMGYGVIRKCYQGYKIGPLFAENFTIADSLFQALVTSVDAGPIYLDIPQPNDNAIALVEKHKMQKVFSTLRMYRNGLPEIDLNGIYGITTYEIG